jgi:hypothetical protein
MTSGFFISDTLSNIDKSRLKIFRKFDVADLQYLKTSEIRILYISTKKNDFDKRFFVSDTFLKFTDFYRPTVPTFYRFSKKVGITDFLKKSVLPTFFNRLLPTFQNPYRLPTFYFEKSVAIYIRYLKQNR